MGEIADNLSLVRERIARAARRAGRREEEIELVAVTKTVEVARIREAIQAGVKTIGENRVQEASIKHKEIGPEVNWHMVGHLQRNKAKKALEVFDLIHSVDSSALAEEIDRRAGGLERKMDVLLEVNVSGEESKFGLKVEEVFKFLEDASKLKNIHILGLMTMTPFTASPETSRPYFRKLRCLSEEIKSAGIEGVEMKYLSMGMSQDFETAIEEGANMVRVGTAIFGERKQ